MSPQPDPAAPTPDDLADLADITRALDQEGATRVARLARTLRAAVWVLCALAALTGATSAALGLWAWRREVEVLAVTEVVAVLAVALPLYVAWRSAALARAIADPPQVVAQAKDLVGRATGSPELHRLARNLRNPGGRRGRAGTGGGKLRRALASGRTISAVIGLAQPDPKRHALLVPFTPERLRNLWLAITVGFWLWIAAAVLALWAVWAVLLRAV